MKKWAIGNTYFCDSKEDAEILAALRTLNDEFDYAYGYDCPLEEDNIKEAVEVPGDVREESTPLNMDDIMEECFGYEIETLGETLEEDGDEAAAWRTIEAAVEAGKTEIKFLVVPGE